MPLSAVKTRARAGATTMSSIPAQIVSVCGPMLTRSALCASAAARRASSEMILFCASPGTEKLPRSCRAERARTSGVLGSQVAGRGVRGAVVRGSAIVGQGDAGAGQRGEEGEGGGTESVHHGMGLGNEGVRRAWTECRWAGKEKTGQQPAKKAVRKS